jgi:hypothetical protein
LELVSAYHFPLFLAVDEVVVVLHRDELVPAVLLGNILQRLELPGSHRASTNVPHPALLDDVVEGLHDLFPWCFAVQAVDLEDVDVRTQPLNALLDGVEDVFPAQPHLVHCVAVVG